MKRIRPAPMGRAFRVVKRTAHLTVAVTERPQAIGAAPEGTPKRRARAAVAPGGAPKRRARAAAAAK
jgi:large subunit ribosomal protein L22